jgi:predicted amidohydrolase YtcJ
MCSSRFSTRNRGSITALPSNTTAIRPRARPIEWRVSVAIVSANPYYVYSLGDVYAKQGLGADRARVISRLGSLRRAGARVALHSDFTMAPVRPLLLAWVAANRITADGAVFGPE